jgi:epoxyqueuosine reductase
MDRRELTHFVKARARAVGFDAVGIAAADRVRDADRIRAWLDAGRHGEMAYLARHVERRVDPRELLPGARSVVSVALGYYTPHPIAARADRGKISRYAWGDDYHDIVKDRLFAVLRALEAAVPGLRGKCCVDTAPIPDRYWAVEAGIGWLGKHTNVITRRLGSWVFLGELVLDRELDPDPPLPDRCGSCRRCLDACPTNALPAPYQLDATRCISYWTIESRSERFPPDIRRALDGWIFGCDICQDVCPWNRKFARPTSIGAFAPRGENVNRPLAELSGMDEASFARRFRRSPVKRAKWRGFLRNVREAAGPDD